MLLVGILGFFLLLYVWITILLIALNQENISYERRFYESVDYGRLSLEKTQKGMKK